MDEGGHRIGSVQQGMRHAREHRNLTSFASEIHKEQSVLYLLLVIWPEIAGTDRDRVYLQGGCVQGHQQRKGVIVARIGVDDDATDTVHSRLGGRGYRPLEAGGSLRERKPGHECGEPCQ